MTDDIMKAGLTAAITRPAEEQRLKVLLMDALGRWYRAHHHGDRDDEALMSDLLAKAYADWQVMIAAV